MSEEEEKEKKVILSYTKEKLLDLLPAVYRQHDYNLGKPLEELMSIIAENVAIIEKDIGSLYEDWFIETCNEWVCSYIADMLCTKSLITSRASLNTSNPISQRAYVANTIAYRRRKGTASILEQLARDITLWGAKTVEFFQMLATTQNLNHLRLANHSTPDIRDTARLELLDTPFDKIVHTIEIRRIINNRGHYNIPNVGIFLWRLQSFPSPMFLQSVSSPTSPSPPSPIYVRAFRVSSSKFMFNQFGYAVPLFNTPLTEQEISHLAEEINVPSPIRIRAIYEDINKYYGVGKSIFIRVKYNGEEYRNIKVKEIEICNLSKWDEKGWQPPSNGKVYLDPITGKIALSNPAEEVRVKYHYGFASKIGGGSYVRPDLNIRDYFSSSSSIDQYKISQIEPSSTNNPIYNTIQNAINAWNASNMKNVVFEILDSEKYEEDIEIRLPIDSTVMIKAAQEQRPILQSIKITGQTNSKLILDGICMGKENDNDSKSDIMINIGIGCLKTLTVRHCTLVPGRNNTSNKFSIYLEGGNDGLQVSLDRTICGRVQILNSLLFDWKDIISGVKNGEGNRLLSFIRKIFNIKWLEDNLVYTNTKDKIYVRKDKHLLEFTLDHNNVILTIDGQKMKSEFVVNDNKIYIQSDTSLEVQDSIIDAKGDNHALSAHIAEIKNTSVFGKTEVNKLKLASNSIFTDTLNSKITQQGCVRFSYLPPNSRTPLRYMCQPVEETGHHSIRPRFTSQDYGDPGYAQLHRTVAKEIFEGGDNGAEMGAFNHLFQPQRITDLKVSLNEYLRFGLETGVYLVT